MTNVQRDRIQIAVDAGSLLFCLASDVEALLASHDHLLVTIATQATGIQRLNARIADAERRLKSKDVVK